MGLLTAFSARSAVPRMLPEESHHRNTLSIQTRGVLLISASSLILVLTTASECHSITHLPSLLYGLVLWVWWGVLATVLWSSSFQTQAGSHRSLPRLGLHALIACAAATIHLMLLGSLSLIIPEWKTQAPTMKVLTSLIHLNRFGLEILIYGFIFGLAGIVQAQIRAQRHTLESLELQRQLSAAQLKALQMQLEPHFLFNTLNAITTLVELGRQSEAAKMLGHLNILLKRTLEQSTPQKIPLSQELEIVEHP